MQTSRGNSLKALALSIAAAFPSCSAVREQEQNDAQNVTLPTAVEPNPLSFEFSSVVRSQYLASGFTLGEGPVFQNSLVATVNQGPLTGASFGTWTNLDVGGEVEDSEKRFNEVDLFVSYPLIEGPVELRATAQYWDFISTGSSAYVADLSASTTIEGTRTNVSGLVRTLLPFEGQERGHVFELRATQPVYASEILRFNAELLYGSRHNFFGVDGDYMTPGVGLSIPLSDSATLGLQGGYQHTFEPVRQGEAVVGVGVTIKF